MICCRDEIDDLQLKVTKERDHYQSATQSKHGGLSAVPYFNLNDKVNNKSP